MSRISKVLFLLIIALFLFTRLYKISEIPSSVYWDEASIGYNAYSILQIGKDEWGDFLPLHFRAFGEFKLPVYIYTLVPFIGLFGLNEISVRLPSVFFSLGIVIITFFLAKKMSGNIHVGLWSSFLLTISPWFFIFSRTGYEATAGLFFYILGINIFLSIKNKWRFIFLTLSFILSMYSYNSFRIISPLTIILLVVFSIGNLKQYIKENAFIILLSLTFLVLTFFPIYRLYKYDAGANRLGVVRDSVSSIIPNYLSHFSPIFLFINGDKNLRSQQLNFGQLNYVAIILLPLGLIYASKLKYGLLTILLIVIAPIPAALTKESPHALRSIAVLPFISIISGLGIVYITRIKKYKLALELIFIVCALVSFANYFLNFINVYPIQSSSDWQIGYKKIFVGYKDEFSSYDNVIISNQYAQPYIFGLYYLKYNPNKFQQEVIRNSVDQWSFSTVSSFNKFIFNKISLENIPAGKSLIFATPIDKLTNLDSKEVILNLDNSVAFYIYEYKK